MLVKLEWLGYRIVKKKLWRYLKPFSSDTGTLQTDRQTDRWTNLLYPYRASSRVSMLTRYINGVATRLWKKLKICLFVSTEYTNVTDRRTDRRTELLYQYGASTLPLWRAKKRSDARFLCDSWFQYSSCGRGPGWFGILVVMCSATRWNNISSVCQYERLAMSPPHYASYTGHGLTRHAPLTAWKDAQPSKRAVDRDSLRSDICRRRLHIHVAKGSRTFCPLDIPPRTYAPGVGHFPPPGQFPLPPRTFPSGC